MGSRRSALAVPRTLGRAARSLRCAVAVLAVATPIVLLVTGAMPFAVDTADAVPGSPGTPQAASSLFSEDFQNVPGPSPVQTLSQYTGASGQKYTANRVWLTNCNGLVSSALQSTTDAASVTACANASNGANGQLNWNRAQQLAYALGLYTGGTAAAGRANYATSAYTAADPGAGLVEFQTATNVPIQANRFVTVGVDVAALNCQVSAPQLQFQLLDPQGTATNVGTTVNACTSTSTVSVPAIGQAGALTANVGTTIANNAVLLSGSSVGIRMINNNGSGTGNDHSFDNVRLLDVTPQLDKAFSPASVVTGGTSTLTLTITNTSELGAKNGWSFTDTLPSGLRLASPTSAATTCPSGVVTGTAGGGSLSATGNLAAGMASCTVTVSVTSSTAGTYTNGPSNVTTVGLNPPGTAQVTFARPAISIVKSAGTPNDVNRNGLTDTGDTIPYSFTVTNTGDVNLSGVGVNDAKVTGVACPSTTLAIGASEVCTASYTVTASDFSAGSVVNTATATGTPPSGPTVTSSPSSTTTPLEGGGITVVKRLPVRASSDDQFVVAATTAAGTVVTSATTSGTATTATSSGAPVALNTTYTITDTITPGSPTAQSRYTAAASCSDPNTGTTTALSGSGPRWSFTPTARTGYVCTVTNTARTTLTLTKKVASGTVPATAWTLSAAAPQPALQGPSGATGTPGASADVTAGVAYTLGESGGPDTYTAQGPWTCSDASGAVVVVRSGAVAVPDGKDVTCSITNSTAQLVLLKHVVTASMKPADWALTATPPVGFSLTTATAVGAENPSASNTFEVRPDSSYTLTETLRSEAGPIAYRQIRIQQLVSGTWTDIDAQGGSPTVSVPAGQTATYRFVNDTVPTIALPLTGGLGSDRVLLAGAAVTVVAIVLAALRHRGRRSGARRRTASATATDLA